MNFNEQCITLSQMNLINNSRYIWRTISTWSRAYLISRYLRIGTEEALFTRLFNESSKYGDMLRLIFGAQFAENFTWLFNEYTIALRDLISAQKEGSSDKVNMNLERMYRIAAEMAHFLADANPFWDEDEWRNIFETYLRYTVEMANSFIKGDYSKDVEAYDRLTAFTNSVGDYFAQGIFRFLTFNPMATESQQSGESAQNSVDKTPDTMPCLTLSQVEAIYSLRMFRFELATWTRYYLISRYLGIGDLNSVLARLNRVVDEYGIMLSKVFGEENIKEYLQLLYKHIELLTSLISAQIERDEDAVNNITKLIYENIDRISSLLASLNPFWDETQLRNMLYQYLQSTFEESLSFLAGEYDKNINVFADILTQSENRGNYLARGLYDYITNQ